MSTKVHVKELADDIHSHFAAAYAIEMAINHEWLENVIASKVKKIQNELLLELEGEARKQVVAWENSEDWDGTTNDGLYSFIQTLSRKRQNL